MNNTLLIRNHEASKIRKLLSDNPELPCIDMEALDSYLFDVFYYSPHQSTADVVDRVFEEEILSTQIVGESSLSNDIFRNLERYVALLYLECIKYTGQSSEIILHRNEGWRYVCYKNDFWVIQLD